VANLPPVSTTQAELVAKFAACVVDTGGKFAADVVDTAAILPPVSTTQAANFATNSSNFATGVVDTGGAP
jgi:hypothetical protein